MFNIKNYKTFIIEKRVISGLEFEDYDDVIDFVKQKHKFQTRKFSGEPYVFHPARVAKLTWDYTKDKNLTVSAFSHDLIEDTDINWKDIKTKFGIKVAKIVQELTSNDKIIRKKTRLLGNKNIAKSLYLLKKMLKMSDEALTIKLIDRLDNTSDFNVASPKFIQKTKVGTRIIIKNLKKNRKLNKIQKEIIYKIETNIQ